MIPLFHWFLRMVTYSANQHHCYSEIFCLCKTYLTGLLFIKYISQQDSFIKLLVSKSVCQSSSLSVILSVIKSVSHFVSHQVCQSFCHLSSQSIIQSDNHPVGQSSSRSIIKSVNYQVSQSSSQSIIKSDSQGFQSASQSLRF